MTGLCVIVSSNRVQQLRTFLRELGLHDQARRLKHLRDENLVAVPIQSTLSEKDLEDNLQEKMGCGPEFEIKRMLLPKAKSLCFPKPEVILREALKELVESKGYQWTTELAADVPKHWEIHGDMVLIPSTSLTMQLWQKIGDDLWPVIARSLSGARLAQKSVVHTDGFRSPRVELLLGTSGWVEQVDNGIRYTYDITKCMFSSGNISEKLRLASFDCTGEVVVDLYAGIGYFTLPYLVHTGVKHLHACEWNPDAVEALRRNLEMNGVQDRCTVHAGDNRQVCPRGVADRVNLGLIPSSRDGWLPACQALRPDSGGILHIHYNVNTKPSTGNQRCHSSGKYTSKSCEPEEMFRREAKCSRREASHFDDCRGNVCTRTDDSVEQNGNCKTDEIIQCVDDELSSHDITNSMESPAELSSSVEEMENLCFLTIENHFTEKAPGFYKKDNFVNENDIRKGDSLEVAEDFKTFQTRNQQGGNHLKCLEIDSEGNYETPFLCHTVEQTLDQNRENGESVKENEQNLEDIVQTSTEEYEAQLIVNKNAGNVNGRGVDIFNEHVETTQDFIETRRSGMLSALDTLLLYEEVRCQRPEAYLTPVVETSEYGVDISGNIKGPTNCKSKPSYVANAGRNSKWLPWAQEVAMDIKNLLERVHRGTWRTEILHIEHVKSYAPFVDHVVLDLRCKPVV